jgi:hypothetical protein
MKIGDIIEDREMCGYDEFIKQNKDEKDTNAIYGWETFPLEKNFDWNKQNKEDE